VARRAGSDVSLTSTAPATDLEATLSEILDPEKLWAVILWNDDVNTFEHVIETLMAVLACSAKQATKFAETADTEGRCLIALRPKDEAQLIVEQFLVEKINASMEKS
jgi:ATP-dependent Clp protease adaptor protein ClpS